MYYGVRLTNHTYFFFFYFFKFYLFYYFCFCLLLDLDQLIKMSCHNTLHSSNIWQNPIRGQHESVLNSGAPTEQAVPVPLMAAVLLHEREKMIVIVTVWRKLSTISEVLPIHILSPTLCILWHIIGLLHEYWWILCLAIYHIALACNNPFII